MVAVQMRLPAVIVTAAAGITPSREVSTKAFCIPAGVATKPRFLLPQQRQGYASHVEQSQPSSRSSSRISGSKMETRYRRSSSLIAVS